jgi:hypothetical protein
MVNYRRWRRTRGEGGRVVKFFWQRRDSAARSVLVPAFLVLLFSVASRPQSPPDETWRFAVSGDSRNCGDVVMPAIAGSVVAQGAKFYWHLGDFRLGYAEDEDMKQTDGEIPIDEYHRRAWDDFIEHQVEPFGPVTVHLGIGNHELYMHGATSEDKSLSRSDFTRKFAKWLGAASYYDWRLGHVHFINLDNSMDSGFDERQVTWLENLLKGDGSDSDIRAVVVGMHRALPNSLACSHSMNGDPRSTAEDNLKSLESGRRVYADLWNFRTATAKRVYVLASHSHFYVENIFNSAYWNNRNEKDKQVLNGRKQETILEGWLVGTAGAVRYRLPDNLPPNTRAVTYTYGYLLGTVTPDGAIAFEFHAITKQDVPIKTKNAYGKSLLDFCFLANRDDAPHPPEESCNEQ